MSRTNFSIKPLLFLVICLVSWNITSGQLLWPGDINKNGIVNNIDLLYYGIARDSEGPARLVQSTEWIGHQLPDPWEGVFSDGINYCEADADGRGDVDKKDRDAVWKDNYGETTGTVVADQFLTGNPNADPVLLLVPQEDAVEPGKRLKVDVYLGSNSRPVSNLFGLCFTLNFNPELVADDNDNKLHKPTKVRLKLDNNTWLDGQGDLKAEEYVRLTNETGTADVAIIHKGPALSAGYGKIGEFSIVMEDIVLDYDETLLLQVDRIKAVDLNLNEYPIAPSIAAVTVLSNVNSDFNPDDCCNTGDKPLRITATYTGEDCFATHTDQDYGQYDCAGDPNYAQTVYVIANEKSNPYDGKVWFTGTVGLGQAFMIDASAAGEDDLKNDTYVHIFAYEGGPILQLIKFKTDCNQAITSDDQYGAVRIDGVLFKNGSTCGAAPPPPAPDCCDAGDKPTVMNVTYTGSDCDATYSQQNPSDYNCSGDSNNDSQVYIVANEKSDPTDGKIWFTGTVNLGQSFEINANSIGENELKSRTYIHIYAYQGGPLLQTVEFKTDCSENLTYDDQYGAIAVNDILFKNGYHCDGAGQGLNSYVPTPGDTFGSRNGLLASPRYQGQRRPAREGAPALEDLPDWLKSSGMVTPAGQSEARVYPNPVAADLWIEMLNDPLQRVELFDQLGKRILSLDIPGTYKHRIDMSEYPSGVYLLRVHTPISVSGYLLAK